ncbi:Thioredoxin-like fold protein [Cordyceps fumosorosea ARSEF 2679]|uniref:Thioredoxin-like fold protein n=1 Tax=Cordyceps fumosorosea (strain ARSEF 2679) TaxID=1081104 RepID=A0A167I8Z5_CORFA|nr:Thioredoxin-like fold protein [Cordyceps fumosorosea ARSEF 2679]OAA48805.1 Thioredoxin-like fold protein [Cordyceps fumosorosea ARSEF 2679]
MTAFNIQVVSDTVCPWCFVGHRQLQQAIKLWHARHPESSDTFNIEFLPYQLQPEFPRGPGKSVDKEAFLRAKFGDAHRLRASERLTAIGAPLGIAFRFGGRVGNTRDSHRLIELAKAHGADVANKTVEGIMSAYFEQERDITTREVLGEVAAAAGIPAADFRRAIVEGDEYGARVDEASAAAREGGVDGVPAFTIQDRFRWSGARDPEDFVKLLERVKQTSS